MERSTSSNPLEDGFQHPWHVKEKGGQQQPLPYCTLKKQGGHGKVACKCGMVFPKKVSPKSAPHFSRHGLAKLYDLPIRGRRSMVGAVVPERTDEHF
eukprot:3004506-Karenia_brevis.AAC.1